jgi:predicted regulator of Ras-like GTPase activity (Roadblock/LC7/MglB family)
VNSNEDDESSWQEFPQQLKEDTAATKQQMPSNDNQDIGYQARLQSTANLGAALETSQANSRKELMQRIPPPPPQIKTFADDDSDGWTTVHAHMQKTTKNASAPSSAKLFDLSEQKVEEVFSRIKEKPRKKDNKKAANKQKQISKLGKISVAVLQQQGTQTGQITDLGKFLLDPEAVYAFERILQNEKNTGTLKRLSVEHSKLIDKLQSNIAKVKGVTGSIVIGHDGTVIASKIPESMVREEIAAWAFTVQVNSKIACQLLSAEAVFDIVLTGGGKDLAISDFGGFLLVTLMDGHNPKVIAELIDKFDKMRH